MSVGRVVLDHVWKRFRYGDVHTRLRDAIPALAMRPFRRQAGATELRSGDFWALRDVSFEVKPGEALGVIGPNGAGKSTVLKLLTGIMEPTAGVCRLRGRVGALIEVAAGFHPDLTGRENVFLQGVIMGMPRREIARKFDEIVAFAELAPFIDTPVKRYSSGMEARLGFAIAAHLEPEVLLVDEVLAVGDAAFQAKALQKVTQLVRREIPVVMVTHDLEAMAALCSHAILLERGVVLRAGTPEECIEAYRDQDGGPPPADQDGDSEPAAERDGGSETPTDQGGGSEPPPDQGSGSETPADQGGGSLPPTWECGAFIEGIQLSESVVDSGERLEIMLDCSVRERLVSEPESIWLRVRSAWTGATVHEASSDELGRPLPTSGAFVLTFELQVNLPPGYYLIETLAWDPPRGQASSTGPGAYFEARGTAPSGSASLPSRVRLTEPAT